MVWRARARRQSDKGKLSAETNAQLVNPYMSLAQVWTVRYKFGLDHMIILILPVPHVFFRCQLLYTI